MREELEFASDSKYLKVYNIEQIDNNIYIEFGKKNHVLQKKEFIFKTTEEAFNVYNKKIKEKINKGYNNKLKSNITIEIENEFIYILINYCKQINELENIYDDEIFKFFNNTVGRINKQIQHIQNKNTLPFLKSGIIIKKINNKLKEKLLIDINNFSNKKIPDYHPGSDNKVLDIVHPSLYPLIANITEDNKNIDFWNRTYENSKYQWMPSEFKIDINGKCKIASYINNLPLSEKSLYENIEKLFEFVLPQFEDIWSYSNTFKFHDSDLESSKYILEKLELKNMNLQVITKIVKISLKNKNDLIGAWHVEGMSHENIVAAAVCTLEQTKNFNSKLYFKRFYSNQEAETIMYNVPQYLPNEYSDFLHNTLVPLGKIKIHEGDIVIFPNSHIHKVDMVSSNLSEQIRTVIVFWLINPNIKITSTKDIPQQKYSLSKANKNRLELMKERTFYKQTFNQRDLNLCEH